MELIRGLGGEWGEISTRGGEWKQVDRRAEVFLERDCEFRWDRWRDRRVRGWRSLG